MVLGWCLTTLGWLLFTAGESEMNFHSHNGTDTPVGMRQKRRRAVSPVATLGLTLLVTMVLTGCEYIQNFLNVAPWARISTETTCLVNTAHTFDGSRSKDLNGDPLSYAWDYGDGTTGAGEVTSHTYAEAGSYEVILTVTDPSGLTGATSVVVDVTDPGANQVPTADAGGDQWVIVDEVVDFDGSGSSDPEATALTYEWDFGDGSSASGESVMHTYTSVDSYVVTLTVTDAGGLSDDDTASVVVSPPGNQQPTADAGQDQAALVGDEVSFDGSGSSDPEDGSLTYEWDFGDGSSGSGVSVNHTYTAPDTYIVTLTVTDPGGLSDDDTVVVVVSSADAGPRQASHIQISELWDGLIPEEDIQLAKDLLHIGYGHTSHGSQIADGMTGLVAFANAGNLGGMYTGDMLAFSADGAGDTLHLFQGDNYGDGPLDHDAGYYPHWVEETREFLNDPANSEYNVIMWSWCWQLAAYTAEELQTNYLQPMAQLEVDYPDVAFVYMTGHLNGSGEDGNVNRRNEELRAYCAAGNKWLYDFADIESYDPDGEYYLDRLANDACDYDSNGDGVLAPARTGAGTDANWAIDWQNSHTENVDWYTCGAAHTEPLNSNLKAYAAWWLFVRIAQEMDS
jgi:PKD repeat protein